MLRILCFILVLVASINSSAGIVITPRPLPPYVWWGHRPGYFPGWHYNFHWRPYWYNPTYTFPNWYWYNPVPVGFWQCIAFNGYNNSFVGVGVDQNIAAYNALHVCGGPYYQMSGCFIPMGYCQFRY
ncbi:MAG: hypothetical protein IPM57_10350 [Oligoflexia bacterium]|nr:hypothetical protein [Oligoflexia bacterium]